MYKFIVCNLIERIRVGSGMYIGEPSVKLLNIYIEGYLAGARDFGCFQRDIKYYNFTKWITQKYDIKDKTIDWAGILIRISGDDENAFYLFWQVWDEYLNE